MSSNLALERLFVGVGFSQSVCAVQETVQENESKPGGQRWEPVKLLRAEWAHPRSVPALYSRVLYITNLPHVSFLTGNIKQRSQSVILNLNRDGECMMNRPPMGSVILLQCS